MNTSFCLKSGLFRIRRLLIAAALLSVVSLGYPTAHANPFVDFSRSKDGQIGVAGYPAVEVLPAGQSSAMVVARESPLQGNITYSSGYLTAIEKFTPPSYFSFSIYGYHSQPEWKNIATVDFAFHGKHFKAKPLYNSEGPNRDRSNDAQNSNFFEVMIVKIPADVAHEIVRNNGVTITTLPASFSVPISASKLDRFKQLVNSVDAIAKRQAIKAQDKGRGANNKVTSRPRSEKSGLPITEVFDDASGMTRLETKIASISPDLAFTAMVWTEQEGHKIWPPLTAMMLVTVGDKAKWENVESVTISYGLKKLQLTPNAHKSGKTGSGDSVEALTFRVPYRDFAALARSPKFYFTVGDASFAVNSEQATGIHELVKRMSR